MHYRADRAAGQRSTYFDVVVEIHASRKSPAPRQAWRTPTGWGYYVHPVVGDPRCPPSPRTAPPLVSYTPPLDWTAIYQSRPRVCLRTQDMQHDNAHPLVSIWGWLAAIRRSVGRLLPAANVPR